MNETYDTQKTVFERLKQHFLDAPIEDHNDRWDQLWDKEELIPWDRGQPSPALVDALAEKQNSIGTATVNDQGSGERRRRALVPGCGRGYDVFLLASLGFEAIGLDVSESSIKLANKFGEEHFSEYTSTRKPTTSMGAGTYKFVLGDFFKNDWVNDFGLKADDGPFDLIYDYTFFCALHPDVRPAWAKRMSTLLNPKTGRLICLEFPHFKDPSTGGPPFGLNGDTYISHLRLPGEQLEYNSGYPKKVSSSEQNSLALERIEHWKPERTHPVGEGTDWMSVWKKH